MIEFLRNYTRRLLLVLIKLFDDDDDDFATTAWDSDVNTGRPARVSLPRVAQAVGRYRWPPTVTVGTD